MGGKVAEDLISLGLRANDTANGEAICEELREDVRSKEAIGAGEKDSSSHDIKFNRRFLVNTIWTLDIGEFKLSSTFS